MDHFDRWIFHSGNELVQHSGLHVYWILRSVVDHKQ